MAEQRALVLIDGQIQELPIGDTLAGASGGGSFTPPTYMRVEQNAGQVINGTAIVQFQNVIEDNDSLWDSANNQIVIPASLNGQVVVIDTETQHTADTANVVESYLLRSTDGGSTWLRIAQSSNAGIDHFGITSTNTIIKVNTGDLFRLEMVTTASKTTRGDMRVSMTLATLNGGASPTMVQTEITATAYSTVNGDFSGNVIRRMNNGSAQTITIEPSMTGGQPVTFIRVGAGAVSFQAGTGVTIHSAGGNLSIADRYGSATLIPDATTADTYYLIGNLTT